ncbi:MAG: SDR family NAD(P)-dependent oxidoreductase [Alphaproteobacteria bacterium]|nr:SDR family NAD(P)-dependent oxidoreductase [Alphaproteobacteria bacterium]
MEKTIAITGATGFAGRHAVAELLKGGYRLRALVRDPVAARLPSEVEIIRGDMGDDEALDALVRGSYAVIHLAGALWGLTSHDYFRVNAHGTVALAEAAIRRGTGRFIHVSSLAAREPGLSPYAASKRAGEDAVGVIAERLNAVILRPPAVYGPGDRATLPLMRELTRPLAVIPGRSDARFSLIHVADLARLIARAVTEDVGGLQEVSDGTPGGYGWADLVAVASAEQGRPVRPLFLPMAVPGTVAALAEIVAKVRRKPGLITRGKVAELYHLDWVARPPELVLAEPTRFAQGFAETLAWYRSAGWLPQASGPDRSPARPKEEPGP